MVFVCFRILFAENATSILFWTEQIPPRCATAEVGQKKYPRLKPHEVTSILEALGFTLKRQTGSYSQYECEHGKDGNRHVVTVDVSVDEFREPLMKSMMRQSGFLREEFYGATKQTRKKIR